MWNVRLMLQENAKLFSTISVTFCISTSKARVFLYSLFLPALGVVSLPVRLFRYLNRCVAFNLQYPNHKWCWTFFLVLICHLYILFEVSLEILYPFFNWIICFLTDVFGVFFYVFWIQIFCQIDDMKIFSQRLWLLFPFS